MYRSLVIANVLAGRHHRDWFDIPDREIHILIETHTGGNNGVELVNSIHPTTVTATGLNPWGFYAGGIAKCMI